MKSLLTLLGKLNPAGVKKYLTDENVIFASVLFLVGVFAALIATDGYLFYTVRRREAATPPLSVPVAAFTPQDIDETIKLINRREQEYNALLNAK